MASSRRPSRCSAALALALGACVASPSPEPPAAPAPAGLAVRPGPPSARRAILVSFDALNERRALETVPPDAIPALRALFDNGACASSARPAFPSVTAPGHAALWTGTYGNVNGIAANGMPQLPRGEHALTSWVSGYFVDNLRAEPIWITAARAGLRATGHHGTQAPGAPGYPGVDGEELAMVERRAEATQVLSQRNVFVMNGYNVMLAPTLVLTEREAAPAPARGWRNLEQLRSAVPPLEIAWLAGTDSLYALLHGGTTYDRVLLATQRDVARGTVARVAAEDTSAFSPQRPLARHFAEPVFLDTPGGIAPLTGRLFRITPDGQRFLLLVPEMRVVQGNHPDEVNAYQRAIGGWYGNGALSAYRAGRLGTTLMRGGDGVAEQRYLESLELLARQFIRGGESLWTMRLPQLHLDYLPLIDEVDHEWFGIVDTSASPYNAALAARVQPYRVRAWQLADQVLASLQSLVADNPEAALVVSGDHGMRSYWMGFRPNVVLKEAGLLALDSAGRVDLSRTRAYSPTGYYIMLNRTAWQQGIVTPAEERATLDAVERAMLAARTPEGNPLVVRTWRSDAAGADTLGLGGPTGGDLYYDVARGYFWNSGLTGPVTATLPGPVATHGFPSTSPEMHTVLCMWGDAIVPRRIGPVRNADAALIVADWLGMPHPPQATGTSPYRAFLGTPH
jgi:hypothetical protein